jgi:hypothetical protein
MGSEGRAHPLALAIIRGLISVLLLVLSGFLFFLAAESSTADAAIGFSGPGGVIIGGVVTYWLTPGGR